MPVYNGANFLEKAILSITNQTLQDWELIIVNDGSTDGTDNILNYYSMTDNRIRVINQQNCGVSIARQKGLELIQGKYFIQVDADDWVEPNYLMSMYDYAETTSSDMVWCDCYYEDGRIWNHVCEENVSVMLKKIIRGSIWGSVWNRMFRTEIIKEKKAGFPNKRMSWGEDCCFCVSALLHCNKIRHVQVPLYHYNDMNQMSLQHNDNQRFGPEDRIVVLENIRNDIVSEKREMEFIEDIRIAELWSIRGYVDDMNYRDYNKFMNTYPDAIAHIADYPEYPSRLKVIAWLLSHNLQIAVPFAWRFCILLRRLGLMKESCY